jgi:hypothetical protein
MTPHFSRPVQVLEAGALDQLALPEIRTLGPEPGETGLVARLRDGSETLLSHAKPSQAGQVAQSNWLERSISAHAIGEERPRGPTERR